MILKACGSILLFASCSALGFYMGSRESFRINELGQMKKALTILLSEIEFNNLLPEAAENISCHTRGVISALFLKFSENLLKKDGTDIPVIWAQTLKDIKAKSYFTSEDIEAFADLGNTFGYMDKKMQVNNIKLVLEYIESETEILYKRRDKNKKMYQSLGILGGLLLVIITI